MTKKFDKEKLFMTVLIFALIAIFVGLFSYGLSSVLAMEGTMPPNILEEGVTPAPETKEEAVEFLDNCRGKVHTEKPKLDTADNFEVDTDTIEVNGSEEMKTAILYAVDEFEAELDSNFEAVLSDFIFSETVSPDFGDEIYIDSLYLKNNQFVEDFECDYIYYQCPSCGEENDEELPNCELCGGVNPYNKRYRDEYTITLNLTNNDYVVDSNFSTKAKEDTIAGLFNNFDNVFKVNKFDISYDEPKVIFKVQRMTDKLTYYDLQIKITVNADITFVGKYSELGNVTISFDMSENNSCSFTWPGLELSEHEMTVEPKGSDNLLATLTCADPKIPTVTWSSSDESILTVDEDGYFKAGKTEGEAIITASFEFNGQTYTDECKVQVKYSVESSKMKDKKVELGAGESATLEVKVSPDNATIKTVTWYTEDENIATVDENGVVTAVSPGVVTVYSLTDDGYYKSSCEVTVK